MSVALQTVQAMAVVEREKMMDSLPQSRQLTLKMQYDASEAERVLEPNSLLRDA